MANALANLKVNLPAQANDLDALAKVAKGSDFLPRLQLVTKGKYVDQGKITPGHFGVPQAGGDEILDLGDSVDIIPFLFRPKAMDVSDKEAIITVFDNTEDPEFKRIIAAPKNTGCFWGPTFLVYERSTAAFYELFFNNASGRSEAGKMRAFLPTEQNGGVPGAATITSRYKTKGEWGWHVPVINKCTLEFDAAPAIEAINEAVDKFKTMKGGVEKVQEDENKDDSAGTSRPR